MVKRKELIQFIHHIIGEELFTRALALDHRANGMQFFGSEEVNKVALGVSLNQDFLQQAITAKAQFCIFHHGLDTDTNHALLPSFTQQRLRTIIEHNLNIMGLHFVLDAHPALGNNAVIINKLGAKVTEPLLEWGYVGKFDQPQDIEALSKKCASICEHDVFAVLAGPQKISTFGVVSGSGSPTATDISELITKGIELYITGDPRESTPSIMKESQINYFACGHYATEVFGVQELGKQIKSEFKHQLEVEFIDIPNSI